MVHPIRAQAESNLPGYTRAEAAVNRWFRSRVSNQYLEDYLRRKYLASFKQGFQQTERKSLPRWQARFNARGNVLDQPRRDQCLDRIGPISKWRSWQTEQYKRMGQTSYRLSLERTSRHYTVAKLVNLIMQRRYQKIS